MCGGAPYVMNLMGWDVDSSDHTQYKKTFHANGIMSGCKWTRNLSASPNVLPTLLTVRFFLNLTRLLEQLIKL